MRRAQSAGIPATDDASILIQSLMLMERLIGGHEIAEDDNWEEEEEEEEEYTESNSDNEESPNEDAVLDYLWDASKYSFSHLNYLVFPMCIVLV